MVASIARESMSDTPLNPVSHGGGSGRGPSGRFAKGNRAAKGNPTAKKMAAAVRLCCVA